MKKFTAFLLIIAMLFSCTLISVNADDTQTTTDENTTTTDTTTDDSSTTTTPTTTTTTTKTKGTVKVYTIHKSGTYGNKIGVTIRHTKGSTVYYTINGKAPTTKSKKYKKAFFVYKTCRIKILCVKKNYKSKRITRTYIINKRPLSFKYKEVTSGFHESRSGKLHKGFDILAPKGAKVYSISAGKVVFAKYSGAYGKLVKIKDSKGRVAWYSHLNSIRVKKGQTVKPGKLIGTVGSTGRATTTHLHFELRNSKGTPICPFKYKRYACVWGKLDVNPDYVSSNCKYKGRWYCDACHHKRENTL